MADHDTHDHTGVPGVGGGAAFVGARAKLTAAQSISNITMTAILWDAEDYDTDTFHSTSSNKDRFVAPQTGYYLIEAMVLIAASGSGNQRYAEFKVNNTTVIAKLNWVYTASTGTFHTLSTVYALTAADYVVLNVYQDSGGALNFGSSIDGHMTVTLLGT